MAPWNGPNEVKAWGRVSIWLTGLGLGLLGLVMVRVRVRLTLRRTEVTMLSIWPKMQTVTKRRTLATACGKSKRKRNVIGLLKVFSVMMAT